MRAVDMRQVLKKYNGSWVALKPYTNKVTASGNIPREVVEAAKKRGVKNPVVLKARPVQHLFIG